MAGFYEIIKSEKGFPIKAFVHSVNSFGMHWHSEIEILLILKGIVNIKIGGKEYLLKENDLIVINSMEMHSINKTNEDNILLALQISPNYYSEIYPDFSNTVFNCNSTLSSGQEKFDVIRHLVAEILWEINKQKKDTS